jgi:acyl carrier protein
MADRKRIFDQIAAELRARIAPSVKDEPIDDNTELYRDLGMYGGDLAEFIMWVHEQFGVNYVPEALGPPELPFLAAKQLVRKLLGLEKRYYPSPKVGDIVDQIDRKAQQQA